MRSARRILAFVRPSSSALLVTGMLCAFYWMWLRKPVLYAHVTAEDRVLEDATFLVAAFAALAMLAGLYAHPERRRPGTVLLLMATSVFALEEISWGQRLLGVPTPAFIAERNLQGELTLHNMFEQADYLALGARAAAVYAAGMWLGARSSTTVARWCADLGLPVVAPRLWPLFIAPACLVDLRAAGWPLPRFDEVAEFVGALALAALACDLAREGWPRHAVAMILGTLLLGALVLAAGGSDDYVSTKVAWLSREEYPRHRMYTQALALTEYVDTYPALQVEENRLQRGLLLAGLGRHRAAQPILEGELARRMAESGWQTDPEARLQAAMLALGLRRTDEARAHAAALSEVAAALIGAADDPDAAARGYAYRGLAALVARDRASARAALTRAGATVTAPSRLRLDAWMRVQRKRIAMVGGRGDGAAGHGVAGD